MQSESVVDALLEHAAQIIRYVSSIRTSLTPGSCMHLRQPPCRLRRRLLSQESIFLIPVPPRCMPVYTRICDSPPHCVSFKRRKSPAPRISISTTRGPQKPPWHLPIPARVRSLTSDNDCVRPEVCVWRPGSLLPSPSRTGIPSLA